MRTVVGVVVQANGVLHSIWHTKEDAEKYLDKEENKWMKEHDWRADEFLVRNIS